MDTLLKPRRLAMIVAVMLGTFVGSWAAASPTTPTGEGTSSSRSCSSTLCTNLLWMRAPVLRSHSR
jgi:hypothetical protein